MKEKIRISGFADEISADFDVQLKTVTDLGMHYISLRSADGIGVADYTPDLVKEKLLPRLKAAGVGVSSLGSPIGKVDIKDEAGFQKQLAQLKTLCEIAHLLDCRYIRMFSFYMPKDEDPADYRTQVIDKLRQFIAVAEENDVVLLHENEKEIYGDTGARCLDLMQTLGCPILYLEDGKAEFYANFEALKNRAAARAEDMAPREEPAKKQGYGKEQRRRRAELRTRIRTLENEIEELGAQIVALESEINDPEVLRDHLLLRDKCDELDDARFHQQEKFDEWEKLSEEQERLEAEEAESAGQ